MPPALIVAGITAAATIGGAALQNKASNKAADRAADTSLQVANMNNALATQFRAENTANFQPYMESGQRANALLDSFLYGAAPGAMPAAQVGPAPSLPVNGQGGTVGNYGQDIGAPIQDYAVGDSAGGYGAFSPRGARNLGVLAERTQGQPMMTTAPTVPMQPQAGGVTTGAPNALSGYEQFTASPFYQFPLAEGTRQRDHALAAGGMLESGDAIKRAIRYGTDYASSQGLMPYLNLAGQQVNRGVQGAGAIAGVSLNALNAISGNNQNAADAAGNAALLRGNNNAAMYGQIGNALGGLAGSFGSSYGAKPSGGIQMTGLQLPKGW